MRVRLFGLLAAVLGPATISARQAAPPVALPAELRPHLQNGRLDPITSIRGLPLGVRNELEGLFGGALDIAEPGAPFESSGARGALPIRRLVSAACTYVDCVIYYQRGGTPPTFRAALFHWTPNETKLEWAGTAPAGLKTIYDVRDVMLSGAVKGSAGPW
jgi:hypothetical protein